MKDLEKVSLFKHMTSQEVSWMLPKWQPMDVPEGAVIIKEESMGDEMFIIETGRVELYLVRGDVVLLLTGLQEPLFFGEMSFLTGQPRSFTVKAKTDARLHVLHKQDFIEIVNENPKIAAKFLLAMVEDLCNRITVTNRNIENYFLINQAVVDNKSFRDLYIFAHKAPSSSG
ncbi:cyclic nucleotide-binding domain-containing protein [candidate division WOR-3 bacterium]|nr:cyclic nucleotide-binding domain-containing protein [candidate division WOR-3 bacterium]